MSPRAPVAERTHGPSLDESGHASGSGPEERPWILRWGLAILRAGSARVGAVALAAAVALGVATGTPDALAAQDPDSAAVVRDSASAEPIDAAAADASVAAGPAGVLRARVTGLAGSTIYLSFDAPPPLVPGAVIAATRDLDTPPAGALEVLELSGARALVRYDGDPFPLTRGEELLLAAPGSGRIAAGSAGEDFVDRGAGDIGGDRPARTGRPRDITADRTTTGRTNAVVSGPRLSGVLSLESDLRRSSSHYTRSGAGTIERSFVTPGARLRATLGGLPAGLRAHASLRAFHRERVSRRPVDEGRFQVYQAYLEARSREAPFSVRAGRFLHPYEAFADYWDGGLLRIGSRAVGVGGAVGYTPSLTEEGLERDLLKYGGFVDVRAGEDATRYVATLSGTRLVPEDGGAPREVGALAQRLIAGAAALYANVEVERDTTERLTVSRLTAGATLRAGPLHLRGAISRLRAPLDTLFDPALDPTRAGPRTGAARDRVSGGLSATLGSGTVGGDVTFSRDRQEVVSRTLAAHAVLPRALPAATGLQLSGFHWEDEDGSRVLAGSAGVSRRFGPVYARVAYRFDRSDRSAVPIISHGLELSLSFRANGGWDYRVSGFARRGADLETDRVYTRLSKSF